MILSKANLEVRGVASREARDGPLCSVWIEPDGTTVASNGNMLMAVEGVDRQELGIGEIPGEVGVGEGVLLEAEVAAEVIRNMPRTGKGGGAGQFALVTKCDSRQVELTCAERTLERRVIGKVGRGHYPTWKSILQRAERDRRQVGQSGGGRVCVNRKDLIRLLESLDSACPDPSGDNATFIEFGGLEGGVVLRSVNYLTGQHAIGLIMPLDTGGQWLLENTWEKHVFHISAKMKKKQTNFD